MNKTITMSDADLEMLRRLLADAEAEDEAESEALDRLIEAADAADHTPAFDLSDPAMAELHAAFHAMPDAFIAPSHVGQTAEALASATRIALGLDPPGIVEGPGIPELRIAVAMMPPRLEYDAPLPLRRLIHAAQVVIGERTS